MDIIIITHNKFLELGLKILLSRHSFKIGTEYFTPENRNKIIQNDFFIVLCDKELRNLINYMFNGHKIHLLSVESVSNLSDIYNCIYGGETFFCNSQKKSTMNEMVILFYYFFYGYNIANIAYQLGISSKTVYSHIYKIKKKNGISGVNIKYKCGYKTSVC
ncbi:TPA: helix-turn-helix transcriptional regulator [Escherichia coli]